ncbi:MAG TPA: VWA domain-containing protein [Blastocatellia bacterium]|nr:VWA domain-containing protein [Blastocatellia bacterium]
MASTSALNTQEPAVRVEMFSFKSDGYVRVENLRGPTRIQTWNSQKVHIIAEKKSPSGGPLNSSEMSLSTDENAVYIESKHTGDPGRIDITVYIPRRSHLQVTGGEWPVEVTGSLASAVVETVSGSIEFQLPKSADARVAMHSMRGSVRSTLTLTSYERAGPHAVQGRLGRGSAPIILNSQSGDIALKPAPDAPAIATIIDLPKTRGRRTGSAAHEPPRKQDGDQSPRKPPDAGPAGRTDPDDPNSISTPPARLPRGSSAPPAADDQVTIASGGQSQQSGSATQNGPLSGTRRERYESSGGIYAGVRVIRPGLPDDSQSSSHGQQFPDSPPAANSRNSPDPPSGSTDGSLDPRVSQSRRHRPSPSPDYKTGVPDTEIASAEPRPSSPPVLGRDNASSPASERAGDRVSSSANRRGDAIVLGTSVVSLNVSVTDRKGKSLPEIKKEEFQLFENNEPQSIEFFAPTTAPFNLVLLLDLSGSISDKIDVVKSAALHFVDLIGPEDKMAVLTFTRRVQVVSPFTTDRNLLRQRIDSIDRPAGGTAFYEAMWFALDNMLDGLQGQRNAIVVMTDGVDNSMEWFRFSPSRVSFEQLVRRIEESDVIAFPIYIDTEEEEVWERLTGTPSAYEAARSQLAQMAELTGGQLYKAKRSKDLSKVYSEIAAALRTIYSLGYYPTNQERDGTFRRLRVRLSRADAIIRTRKGYYAK